MPRTCHKPDTEPFDIIEWIVERMDFQLAAVTGAGIDGSYTKRTAEYFENARLQRVNNTKRVVTWRRRLRDDSGATDLA
jgi:hypothetical protein